MRSGSPIALALVLLGCAAPQYKSGDLRCAPTGKQCPDGFHCAADDRCWAGSSGPDMQSIMMVPHDLAGAPPLDLAMAPGRDMTGVITPSQCATTNALLCDGFEAAAIDPQWKVQGAGATATLDLTHAYRGSHSIHVHTDSAAANSDPSAAILETRTFPINGTAWVRIWAYFQSPYPSSFDQVINFLDGNAGGASYSMKSGEPINNDYAGGGYRESTMTSTLIQPDRWVCLRMSIGQPGPTGDIHLYVGDLEAGDAQLIGASVTQMVNIAIGTDFFGNPAMGSSDMWIDEVIIDNKMITCAE